MEPLSTGILTSLIANGIITLVSYGVVKAKKIAKYKDSIKKGLEADADLISSIRNVTTEISNTTIPPHGELQATMFQLFLESPTTESIVRQIYSDFMDSGDKRKSYGQIMEEFQVYLAYHLSVDRKDVEPLGTKLLGVISSGCNKALKLAMKEGDLSAHEAKSISRQRVILDELQAIKNNLDFLTQRPRLNLNDIRDFEKSYRAQVGERMRQITIPHFDKAPKVDLDKIFVPPSFICTHEKKEAEQETISLDDFLNRSYRAVVLGDPGGGKSTLAQKICHELSNNYGKRPVGERLLTPVLVILRKYSEKKKKDDCSIIQFIESEVTSKYQLPKGAPPEAFDYLLHNGHILVIFDGLDELLASSHRREISQDIELFCNLFPSVPVLVTSRVVGYEQAPLDKERFETFTIASFDDDQVSDYAKKWFDNDPDLTRSECEERTKAFLREIKIVSDLRSNPLMLALMCNLFRGEGSIPCNRPGIYKKCTEMLLERWESIKLIGADRPISGPKFLLSHLAHWIYSNESLQGGVTEDELIKASVQYLCPRRFEVEEDAEKASKKFIEYCRERAWVFTDFGRTPEDALLYKFTHQTFLEFFTAVYIVRNNNSPEKLWEILSPKVAEREWDVVAQLAFQMLHEQEENATDDLLTLLIQSSQEKKETRWAYLSFGARCLQFLSPTPKAIRKLTEASVKCIIEDIPSTKIAEEITGNLLLANPECKKYVADPLQTEIVNYAKNAEDKVALRAIDLGLMLQWSLHRSVGVGQETNKYWNEVEDRIFEQVDKRLQELAQHNFLAFMNRFYRCDTPVENLFKLYTPDHLFLKASHIVLENVFKSPLAAVTLNYLPKFDVPVEQQHSKNLAIFINCASDIGKILLNIPLPCFSYEVAKELWEHIFFGIREKDTKSKEGSLVEVPVSCDAVFGVWCLTAAVAEIKEKQGGFLGELVELSSPVAKAITPTIEARMHKISKDGALKNLKGYNLSGPSLQLVERWIAGEVSFVKPPESDSGKEVSKNWRRE